MRIRNSNVLQFSLFWRFHQVFSQNAYFVKRPMCGASGDVRGGSAAAATDGAAPSLGARVQAHDSCSNAARPEREEGEKKFLKKY
jgi:hypothetical protein